MATERDCPCSTSHKEVPTANDHEVCRDHSGEYFYGFERSTTFEQLYHRLQALERWKEIAIRPSSIDACDPEDWDLYRKEFDDIVELQERCDYVRVQMNAVLPPIEVIDRWEPCLVPKISSIPGAGFGLFYQTTRRGRDEARASTSFIPKGTSICFYTGHLHNIQSSRQLIEDKDYLMMVRGNNLVDPGPCKKVKARYINDPLNEKMVNCIYVPCGEWRSAIVTNRDVASGEELFVAYGETYWSQQEVRGKRYCPS